MEDIKSFEEVVDNHIKIVKSLKEKQERLTVSINNLMLEEESQKEKTLKAKEALNLLKREIENENNAELVEISADLSGKKELLSELRKQLFIINKELEEAKNYVNEEKFLAIEIINKAKKEASDIIDKAKTSEIVKKNLSVEIDTKKESLAILEKSIIDKEREERLVISTLANVKNELSKAQIELTRLEEKKKEYNKIMPDFLIAKEMIDKAKRLELNEEEIRSEIEELKKEKESIKKNIKELSGDEKINNEEKIEMLKLKGSLIEKETELSQRVSYLKDLYGNLELPW